MAEARRRQLSNVKEEGYDEDDSHNDTPEAVESDADVEATELTGWSQPAEPQPASLRSDNAPTEHLSSNSSSGRSRQIFQRIPTSSRARVNDNFVKRFWRRHVSVAVPHENARDHLALERTFLGYLRTSVSLTMIAVTIAQLFKLQDNSDHLKQPDFYKVGTPLAAVFVGVAILITLIGLFRFWRLQNAMLRGKVRAAGWEVGTVCGLLFALMLVLFSIIVGVKSGEKALNHGDLRNSTSNK